MAYREAIDKKFAIAVSELYDLYNNDELDLAVTRAYELIGEFSMAPFHHMKVWILLGNTLEDWDEASRCRVNAWKIFKLIRKSQPLGEDEETDAAINEVLENLEHLDKALKEERSEGHKEDIQMKEEVEESAWGAMGKLDINEPSDNLRKSSGEEMQDEGQK